MPQTINSSKDDTHVIFPLDQGKKISKGVTGETISSAGAGDASDLVMFLFEPDADPAEIAIALMTKCVDEIKTPGKTTAST